MQFRVESGKQPHFAVGLFGLRLTAYQVEGIGSSSCQKRHLQPVTIL